MREQLVFLLQLQTSDVRVRELDAAATQLPAKLDPLRRDLAKLQGMLDVERGKLTENENWRKGQQDMLDREREALRSAQGKFQASKNSREWSAASREVDNKKKSISDRETELKKVSESSSSTQTVLSSRDADVEALRKQLADSEAAMADQLLDLQTKLAEAKAARDVARGQVEKSWLRSTTRSSASAATRSRRSSRARARAATWRYHRSSTTSSRACSRSRRARAAAG